MLLSLKAAESIHCVVYIENPHGGVIARQATISGDIDLFVSWNSSRFPNQSDFDVKSATFFEENILIQTDFVIENCQKQAFCPFFLTAFAVLDSDFKLIFTSLRTAFTPIYSGEHLFGQLLDGHIRSYLADIDPKEEEVSYIILQPLEGNSDVCVWINATFRAFLPGKPTFQGNLTGEATELIQISRKSITDHCGSDQSCAVIVEILCKSLICTYQLALITSEIPVLMEAAPVRAEVYQSEARVYRLFCAYEVADITVFVVNFTDISPVLYVNRGLAIPNETNFDWKSQESLLILSSDTAFEDKSMAGFYTVAVGADRDVARFAVGFALETTPLWPLFEKMGEIYLLPPGKTVFFYYRHFLNREVVVNTDAEYGNPCMVVKNYDVTVQESDYLYPTLHSNSLTTCHSPHRSSFQIHPSDPDYCFPCVYIIGVLTQNSTSARFLIHLVPEPIRYIELAQGIVSSVRREDVRTFAVETHFHPTEIVLSELTGEVELCAHISMRIHNRAWCAAARERSQNLTISMSVDPTNANGKIYVSIRGISDSTFALAATDCVSAAADLPFSGLTVSAAIADRPSLFLVGSYEVCHIRPISIGFHIRAQVDFTINSTEIPGNVYSPADDSPIGDLLIPITPPSSSSQAVLSVWQTAPRRDFGLFSLICSDSGPFLPLPLNFDRVLSLSPSNPHCTFLMRLYPSTRPVTSAVVHLQSCSGSHQLTISLAASEIAVTGNVVVLTADYINLDPKIGVASTRFDDGRAVFRVWATDSEVGHSNKTIVAGGAPTCIDRVLAWPEPIYIADQRKIPSETVRYRVYFSEFNVFPGEEACGLPGSPLVYLLTDTDVNSTSFSVSRGVYGYFQVVAVVGFPELPWHEVLIAYPAVAVIDSSAIGGRGGYFGALFLISAGTLVLLYAIRRNHREKPSHGTDEELEMRSFAQAHPNYS